VLQLSLRSGCGKTTPPERPWLTIRKKSVILDIDPQIDSLFRVAHEGKGTAHKTTVEVPFNPLIAGNPCPNCRPVKKAVRAPSELYPVRSGGGGSGLPQSSCLIGGLTRVLICLRSARRLQSTFRWSIQQSRSTASGYIDGDLHEIPGASRSSNGSANGGHSSNFPSLPA
jgi:hypothetical protein